MKAGHQASEAAARDAALVAQVRDYAIIALDREGVIETWNAGAEAVKAYRADEIVGRHFSVFYPAEDQLEGLPQRLLQQAREQGRVEHTGWRVRKDGTRFWGNVIITALHDRDGRLTGYGKVTRDLTERLRLESARDSFFAMVSHDLKTPLTALKGFATLLPSVDAEQRAEFAQRIVANADRLSLLVDDLLEHAALRADGIRVTRVQQSVTDLVRATVADLSSLLVHHRVRVEGPPAVAGVDAHVVGRILTNLLGNAVKYSPPGSEVVVRVSVHLGVLRIIVTDRGRGIDPDDLAVIFDEFQRGRLARPDGGTGLGLSSVQQLAGLHGGSAAISSRVEEGTSVTVELAVDGAPTGSNDPLGS